MNHTISFGVNECQLKLLRTRQKVNKSFASDNIRVASFAEGPRLFIASSRFAGFVLEHWQTKVKYQELKKPVGDSQITLDSLTRNHEV